MFLQAVTDGSTSHRCGDMPSNNRLTSYTPSYTARLQCDPSSCRMARLAFAHPQGSTSRRSSHAKPVATVESCTISSELSLPLTLTSLQLALVRKLDWHKGSLQELQHYHSQDHCMATQGVIKRTFRIDHCVITGFQFISPTIRLLHHHPFLRYSPQHARQWLNSTLNPDFQCPLS